MWEKVLEEEGYRGGKISEIRSAKQHMNYFVYT